MESNKLTLLLKKFPFLWAFGDESLDPEIIAINAGNIPDDFLCRSYDDSLRHSRDGIKIYEIWLKMTDKRGVQSVTKLKRHGDISIAKIIQESGIAAGEIKYIIVKKVFSAHVSFEIHEPLRGCTFEQMVQDILEETA